MGKDRFNPYNYNRYLNLPRPAPEYTGSRTLPPKSGMSFAQLDSYRRIMHDRDEDVRRQIIYNEANGSIYSNRSTAWEGAANNEDIMGRPDCRHGTYYDR